VACVAALLLSLATVCASLTPHRPLPRSEIHPDTSLHHRRLQAAADRRRAIVSVREGRRQLTVEERALPLLLPTPHEGDTLLSKTREAGAVESADCHSAEVLAAVKQVRPLSV
jgi:hypothetical protein